MEWRESIARIKKKAFSDWDYWGKPVPGFGDIKGQVLILGLAPGAHGSNRTGRMFTGDASGDFLYPALYDAGFASQSGGFSIDDGLKLKDAFISAVCRCAPPENKPVRDEINNCRTFLNQEISLMKNLKGIVALGKIAFDTALDILLKQNTVTVGLTPSFGHGKLYFADGHDAHIPWLMASYHPSRQNTQTGRLTPVMFQDIWKRINELLGKTAN